MLIYKQRYKPRTSREFTKSDLTVYDSAGNTALNALTVYGKSEVVDGSIVRAGEGYAVVRLADLPWIMRFEYGFFAEIQNAGTGIIPLICSAYNYDNSVSFQWVYFNEYQDKTIYRNADIAQYIFIKDTDFTTVEDFVASLGDATLAYQLADPTQGNAIAVKTDDGTGIDGTMATFTTGTPLRGIPDTTVRDVMEWDGTSGEVTKVCGEVDLGIATYTYDSNNHWFSTITFASTIKPTTDTQKANILSSIYTPHTVAQMLEGQTINMACATNRFGTLIIRNTDYTDPADFKTAMNGVKLVYELATPTTQNLTSNENSSIAALRTFAPNTHVQNNANTDMTVDYTIRVPTI